MVKIVFKAIKPYNNVMVAWFRSLVWSEQEFVEQAAFEFSDTEKMLTIAEELCGPYVWGEYDILVLPPSFPYGGMENPCLTFATPTLLSGDKVG